MSGLNGLTELFLAGDPGAGIVPEAGFIFKWIERTSPTEVVLRYKDENGLVANIGVIGPQGPAGVGTQGPQGIQGIQGPVGPMELVAVDTLTTAVTLTDSTNFNLFRTFSIPVAVPGDYIMMGVYSVRPHSAGNDMRFEWDFDGVTIAPTGVEEHKDSSAAQEHLRPIQYNFGTLAAGTFDFEWYFAKEATGGTAQVKYISMFVFKVG